jgi:hypothetical protein
MLFERRTVIFPWKNSGIPLVYYWEGQCCFLKVKTQAELGLILHKQLGERRG